MTWSTFHTTAAAAALVAMACLPASCTPLSKIPTTQYFEPVQVTSVISFFVLQLISKMAPKSKLKKSAAPDTPKTRGKQTIKRKQSLPEFSPNHTGEPSSEDSQPRLMAVMDLLVDISSRLSTNGQFVDVLMAKKLADEEGKLLRRSLTCAAPSVSSGHTRRSMMTGSGHANHEAISDISDKVQTKVVRPSP